MKTATYTLHSKFDNMRQIGKVNLDSVNRKTLYGVEIDFSNPQKEISDGHSVIARLNQFS
jgi:hypothetical protein